MKRFSNLILLPVLAALLLFAFGCEKGGHIKIYNQTSYPVYAGALGSNYTIGSDSTLTIKVDTGTSSIFNPDVGKNVELALLGETYQIWDAFEEQFIGATDVWVEAGKTTKVYLNPNRACVKVINETDRYIKKIIVQRNTNFTTVTTNYDLLNNLLGPDESWFKPQPPADTANLYYYIVQVVFENDDTLTYGDEQNILHKDEQFLIHVTEEE
jgi:hypothetical protein